jgi:CRISPR-associated endonuclease Csn1
VNDKPGNDSLTFGFDIGIASVGWAVLAPHRIVGLGVRTFDKAETAKEGDSLNLVRRTARLMRRRLRRRAWRLTKLARLLKRRGVIDDVRLFHPQNPFAPSLWRLRVEGLDRCLNAEEWARVIYHLCKHRGFHWISRAEEKQAEADAKGEGGKVKQGLAATARLKQKKGYRSAAEMVLAEFPEAQRNKQGEYGKALARRLLGEELALLFQRQRVLGNTHADPELEKEILGAGDRKSGLFWLQKPPLSGADLLKMLGRCTFEPGEYRAPKASFTAERHVWLTRLNNLRVFVDGRARPLTEAERQVALPLPYQQGGDFKYRQLRAALVNAGHLPDGFRFAGLAYPSETQMAEGKVKHPEEATLVKLPAWQALRLALKKHGLETEWEGMAAAAIEGRPELLDQIAYMLSVFKDDDEVRRELTRLPLPNAAAMIEALLDLRFDKFHALSLKALRAIVPHMESGLRYDEACEKAGYQHSLPVGPVAGGHRYLPPFYAGRDKEGRMVFNPDLDVPRNPVVLRALNQARKVLNALVRKYGSPNEVRIEMARDLSRPLDERRQIEREQTEYRERNDKDRAMFGEHFGRQPKGAEFEKWRLYREQQGKCAYSVEAIDLTRLLEEGYVEIDHALPYSRSFDDGKNNKVLVLAAENRNKGNRTPYEFLGGEQNSERWQRFTAFVESNKAYRQAKRSRLLRKNFGADEAKEFRERNLNDTRYICRFFKNYVERYLQLADGSEARRCVVVSGQLTAFLRARWGLLKIREESDRHHALDAAVVAACTHGMVKRLADYSQRKELRYARGGLVDPETGEVVEGHFPQPWQDFRYELETRLREDDPARLRAAMEAIGTYPSEALDELRPLFVSRAVSKRGGGELHAATLRAVSDSAPTTAFEKVPLSKLNLAKLERMVGRADPRNLPTYDLLRSRLLAAGDDAKKAFGSATGAVRKPSAAGKSAPTIRSIRIEITQNSGLLVRGGIADLGEMAFVDVFKSPSGYTLAPRYAAGESRLRGGEAIPSDALYCFSLRKNDLVEIDVSGHRVRGYFVMYESDGRVTLRAHDQPQPDKKFFRKSVARATLIRKLNVGILGQTFPPNVERRHGLA